MRAEANHVTPPGRVRALFKKLDKDKSGGLSREELTSGFAAEFGVAKLADHVVKAMDENLKKYGSAVGGKQVITANVFSRFYAEVLFRHFDVDNSGTLELCEVQSALGYLVKGGAPPVIAYPPEHTDEKGEVHLPINWFWATFRAMD